MDHQFSLGHVVFEGSMSEIIVLDLRDLDERLNV